MLKKIIVCIIAAFVFFLGYFLLRGDYIPFLRWWAVVAILGLSFMPISAVLFSSFHDKGYVFSKSIGIAAIGYLMWLLSSLHIMKFTVLNCIICTVIGLLLNILVMIQISMKRKKIGQPALDSSWLNNIVIDRILIEEVLFLTLFMIFTYVRGFNPEAFGTEKYMDYGFMTSMMRSDYMPPQDFWFSGTFLNYYYGGQYLATFLTKLSGVSVTVGYNIMLMMVAAFAVVLPYSLVNTITHKFLEERGKTGNVLPVINGAIAGIAVCIAGNMHYPTFKWLEPLAKKFFAIDFKEKAYWFPDATRYIGYRPLTHDKTIHEFPCYSFVLGDLHAHVVNIMFVLTLLGLLFAWLCWRKERASHKLPIWREVFNLQIIAISFLIGLFHTTNYWDFPIYYVVSGAVILFANLIVYNFKGKAVGITALQGITVIGIAEIVALPFTWNFDRIASVPLLTVAHTPLNQLTILWGLPIFVVVSFLCFMAGNFDRKRRRDDVLEENPRKRTFSHFLETLNTADFFIIIIGLCAIGLVLVPELIYIEDIYNGEYKRANTMFKLTYQAFIMFGICFGYIMLRLLAYGETKRQRKSAIAGLILFALSVCYVQNAVHAWYGNIFDLNKYKGLDCTAFLENKVNYVDDVGAINWLNKNVTGMPVVLEANGDSYTEYERISVMTGLPTVLGWRTHEWLWKSRTDILDERAADIEQIYTSTDEKKVKELIEKYKISYIYVGKLEQDKFMNINHDLLKSLGEVVYSNETDDKKNYDTYIVKIK